MNEANFSLYASDMIIEIKEPQPVEIALLQSRHTLFTYLHLPPTRNRHAGTSIPESRILPMERLPTGLVKLRKDEYSSKIKAH